MISVPLSRYRQAAPPTPPIATPLLPSAAQPAAVPARPGRRRGRRMRGAAGRGRGAPPRSGAACPREGGRAALRARRSSQRHLQAIRAPAPLQGEALAAAVHSPGLALAGVGFYLRAGAGGAPRVTAGLAQAAVRRARAPGRFRGGEDARPAGTRTPSPVRLSRLRRRAGARAREARRCPLVLLLLLRLHRGRGSGETGPLAAGTVTWGGQPVPPQRPIFPAGF